MKKDKPDQVIAEPSAALAPYTPAPDFTLQVTPDQRVSLRDFQAGRQSLQLNTGASSVSSRT